MAPLAPAGGLPRSRSFAVPMAVGVCLSVALLSWFGFRAIREWQHSTRLLVQQRTQDSADLLVTALSRDMRAVQESVLLSGRWNEAMLDEPYDITSVLAGAFARYPYPESFFGWRGSPMPHAIVFFNRADRPPPWRAPAPEPERFPVRVSPDGPLAAAVAARMVNDAAKRKEFSVFEMTVHGVAYQVVARLVYADPFREQLLGGLGFTVNLPWVRGHYFGELARQVAHVSGTEAGLELSILDETGARVVGAAPKRRRAPVSRRLFPLLFADPQTVMLSRAPDLPERHWAVEVEGVEEDPTLNATTGYAARTLLVSAIAAAVLALGLAMTSRAVRESARLAEMRSEFVSTVTHELKTPLATIRAVGDSVASGRVTSPERHREYALLVVQESKRLARLVDNLLAYARITDVTEAYRFESLDVRELVDGALHGFEAQLGAKGFAVEVDVPSDLPALNGDRTAMRMLLDNIIDNAVRYSGEARWIGIRASRQNSCVHLAVSDRGIGIPPHELDHVFRRFFRGRRAGSGGSGLGLTIAGRIVTSHRGRVHIDSAVDRGTTVHISIPLAGDDDAQQKHPRG